jgi:hypothetical protein
MEIRIILPIIGKKRESIKTRIETPKWIIQINCIPTFVRKENPLKQGLKLLFVVKNMLNEIILSTSQK